MEVNHSVWAESYGIHNTLRYCNLHVIPPIAANKLSQVAVKIFFFIHFVQVAFINIYRYLHNYTSVWQQALQQLWTTTNGQNGCFFFSQTVSILCYMYLYYLYAMCVSLIHFLM